MFFGQNIDPCKIEGYSLPLLKLDIPEVYEHFDIPHNSNEALKAIFTTATVTRIKKQKTEYISRHWVGIKRR